MGAVGAAGAAHPLPDATILHKHLLLTLDQAAQHIGRLVDQRDTEVGKLLIAHLLKDPRAVGEDLLAPRIGTQPIVARVTRTPAGETLSLW